MATRGLAVGLLAAMTATAPLAAADRTASPWRCASTAGAPPQALEAVRVVPVGLPPPAAWALDRARSLWNDAACNSALDFPLFVAETELPHRVLEVVWHAVPHPGRRSVCGSFAGRRIDLWASTLDAQGVARSCGGPERLAETLAHELGHVLGLEDRYEPECAGAIMSQMLRLPSGELLRRAVRREECAAADTVFATDAERRREQESWTFAALQMGAPSGAADSGGLRPPSPAAPPALPRSARTAPGSRARASAAFRP
jgi:hypothetical protein